MSLRRILKHQAVRVRVETFGPRIEGEREEEPVDGTPFACVVFPEGTREAGRGGRVVEQPQLLTTGLNVAGEPIDLHAEDRIRVTSAPGLDDRMLGEYQVDGEPLAFGRPGATPRGIQVLLKRVHDGRVVS